MHVSALWEEARVGGVLGATEYKITDFSRNFSRLFIIVIIMFNIIIIMVSIMLRGLTFPHVLQGVVTDASPQTVAPSSQEVSGQQQIQVDSGADHVPAYSYQSK